MSLFDFDPHSEDGDGDLDTCPLGFWMQLGIVSAIGLTTVVGLYAIS